MINTNLNGVFYVSSTLIPDMKKKKASCHIINIGSILGKVGRTESTDTVQQNSVFKALVKRYLWN
jgi:NADP-dependent 3-hydroxy acid dehydrogenase YdfG